MNKKIKTSIATLFSVLLTKGNTVSLESLLKSSVEIYTDADTEMFNLGNLMNTAGSVVGGVTGDDGLANSITTTGD